MASERERRCHVPPAVPDIVGRRQIESMLGRCLTIHECTGLPALTVATEVGMVWTEVARIDARILGGELTLHLGVNGLVVGDREQPARDSRLIRDDDHGNRGLVELTNGWSCAGKQTHVLGACEVVSVVDDRSVAIEKHRAAQVTHAQPSAAMSARAKSSSSSGSTVRTSRSSWPLRMRPTTGGVPARRRLSTDVMSPSTAIAREGM